MRLDETVEERFWSKVDIRGPDECWPWMAGTSHGYGEFSPTHGTTVRAHRFAYELVKGPIPADLGVLHKCDFKPCCNPTHLWPGTEMDNSRDCVAKGRQARGESHGSHLHPERMARGERNGSCTHPERLARGECNPSAKLTEDKVREARRLFAEGHSKRAIGRLMGVTDVNIGFIVRGKTWKEIGNG